METRGKFRRNNVLMIFLSVLASESLSDVTAFSPIGDFVRPIRSFGDARSTAGRSAASIVLAQSSAHSSEDAGSVLSSDTVIYDESNNHSTDGVVVNGFDKHEDTKGKYSDLLEEVGLSDKIKHAAHVPGRVVTPDDVFCNRELKLSTIKAIGFDMDYTLAQYKQPAFDQLAYEGAKVKLVYDMGYPEEVLNFDYDHEFWVRGLIIDTQRGNFLKIDRHKYVRMAYHGFQPISSSIRKSLYSRTFNKIPSFSEKHFVNLDTLFQHVDAHLFAHLIDLKDSGRVDSAFLDGKTYEEMYRDIRRCVDLCHRDGVIKDVVAEEPQDYIVHDENLVPMLQNFRESGVKLFLLTNSHWEYTSVAMNFLYHGRKVDAELLKKNEWLELFDIVVVGSCKPAYLIDPNLGLYRVNPEDGSLRNSDGLFEINALEPNGAEKFLDIGKVFQGGNWMHLQAMLQTQAGEEILYVGDHLYADVLRSKRTLGWRTALIVPEISKEMEAFHKNRAISATIAQLRNLRDEISAWSDSLRRQEKGGEMTPETTQKLIELQEEDAQIKRVLSEMTEKYHSAFHSVWGQMFLAGYQDSRLAFYVENYACLYTSKASNLGLISTARSFRTSAEMLPHDKLLSNPNNVFEN